MNKSKAADTITNRKLDKSKHYAEIWGHDDGVPRGARYEQNGLYYNQQGVCLGGTYKPADINDVKQDLEQAIRELAAENAELRRRLAAQGGELPAGESPQPPADGPKEPTEEELDREAIIAQLKQLNVSFPKKASTADLHKILQKELDSRNE